LLDHGACANVRRGARRARLRRRAAERRRGKYLRLRCYV
jgi:hypothetical protein